MDRHEDHEESNTDPAVGAESSPETRTTGSESRPAASVDEAPPTNKAAARQLTSIDWDDIEPGIYLAVRILRAAGVDTVFSCAGGSRHAYAAATVVIRGDANEMKRAIQVCRESGLAPFSVARSWLLFREAEDTGCSPMLDAVNTHESVSEWRIQFSHSFPFDPEHAQRHREKAERVKAARRQQQRAHEEAFGRVLQLEPRLNPLLDCVMAGAVEIFDVWKSYFSSRLRTLVGPQRDGDGDSMLFTEEALDGVLHAMLRWQARVDTLGACDHDN